MKGLASTRRSILLLAGALSLADAQQPGAALQRAPDTAARARLEGEVRRRFARVVQQRVGLTDDQMARLAPIAAGYEQQRRDLQMRERTTRQSLRAALRDERSADPAQVDQLLQTMLDIQKRRVALLESEQRDLATVMTPLQRARFLALQEQVRRRLEQLQQRRLQILEGEGADAPQRRPSRRQP